METRPEPLHTLTHARLRARQGDLRTARRIVSRILELQPENGEARALLDTWRARSVAVGGKAVAAEASPRRPEVLRLERWLARFRRADDL